MRRMVKRAGKLFYAGFFLAFFAAAALAADTVGMTKFERMLSPRTINCWIEGAVMDELIIGARARMTFVCLDRRLGSEIARLQPDGAQAAEYDSVPTWLRQSAGHYLKQRGKTFFAVQFATAKPWDFDFGQIRIGEYSAVREDVLLGDKLAMLVSAPERAVSLPGGFADVFGIYISSGLLKPGEEIRVGYGENLVVWTVPRDLK